MPDLSEVLKEKEHMTIWKKVGHDMGKWSRNCSANLIMSSWSNAMDHGGRLSEFVKYYLFSTSQLDQLNSTSVHCIFQTWALNWKRLHPTSIWKTRSDFGIRLILIACVGTVDRQLFICICLYEWKKTYAAWWICLITILAVSNVQPRPVVSPFINHASKVHAPCFSEAMVLGGMIIQ